jgi:hypothetical protein
VRGKGQRQAPFTNAYHNKTNDEPFAFKSKTFDMGESDGLQYKKGVSKHQRWFSL